ncbi:peptidase M23/M37 family [Thermosulfidibacter takaii ABI70S6]|uniref:Peptidase M23/M37 family n=1 Tax=Thermosulfidibacter takaii (strain DSM 17441 / JCM 13301 / NBRC 103674 / ABI70S6) TaxID=1298851 RepID=A0A0S3QSJ7_THET7|nr:M23 family metallopeptidase [Thermosulfidibacter takaii]BAT71318.1 peptidase M23/M37 family [Thermosulfidibacter takaii ABI70S6]
MSRHLPRIAFFIFFILVLPAFAVQEKVHIKEGETLVDSLIKHDISPDEANLVAVVLERRIKMDGVGAGFEYTIEKEGNIPVSLTIPYDVGEVYKVNLRTLDIKKEKLKVIAEKRLVVGVLRSGDSIYNSIYDKTGDPGLAYQFTRIFRHRIDFHTWTRPGDYYAFICEYLKDSMGNAKYGKILVAEFRGKKVKGEAVYYKGTYYDRNGVSLVGKYLASPIDGGWLPAPLRYRRISSYYTWHRLHPILGIVRPHLGVDYAAPYGTPIKSVADGVVIWKGWIRGYGRTVKIKHEKGIITQYAHMSRYAKRLRVGQRVKKGQVIGYVGMSGLATGPHLDFRIRVNGRFVNPLTFLARHSRGRHYKLVRRKVSGKALRYIQAQLAQLEQKVAALNIQSVKTN